MIEQLNNKYAQGMTNVMSWYLLYSDTEEKY